MNTTELGNKLFQVLNTIPEKSGCEEKTRTFIISILKRLKHICVLYSGHYGIVATFNKRHTYDVAIRAELDAVELPDGIVQHSCGHSGHTAALLATIIYIDKHIEDSKFRDCLFVFQGAEEVGNGAQMIAKIINNRKIKVKEFYTIHNAPEIFCNQLAVRSGAVLSNNLTSKFTVYLNSKGHFGNAQSLFYGFEPIMQYLKTCKSKNKCINYEIGLFTSNGTISSSANRISFTLSIRSNSRDLSTLKNVTKEFYIWLQKQTFVKWISYKKINSHKQTINSRKLVSKIKQVPGLEVIKAPPTWSSDDFFEYEIVSQRQLYFFIGSFVSKKEMYLHSECFRLNPNFIKAAIRTWIYLLKEQK